MGNGNFRVLCVLLVSLVLPQAVTNADILKLRDGRQLKGEVTEDDGGYSVKTIGGIYRVAKDDVLSIDKSTNTPPNKPISSELANDTPAPIPSASVKTHMPPVSRQPTKSSKEETSQHVRYDDKHAEPVASGSIIEKLKRGVEAEHLDISGGVLGRDEMIAEGVRSLRLRPGSQEMSIETLTRLSASNYETAIRSMGNPRAHYRLDANRAGTTWHIHVFEYTTAEEATKAEKNGTSAGEVELKVGVYRVGWPSSLDQVCDLKRIIINAATLSPQASDNVAGVDSRKLNFMRIRQGVEAAYPKVAWTTGATTDDSDSLVGDSDIPNWSLTCLRKPESVQFVIWSGGNIKQQNVEAAFTVVLKSIYPNWEECERFVREDSKTAVENKEVTRTVGNRAVHIRSDAQDDGTRRWVLTLGEGK